MLKVKSISEEITNTKAYLKGRKDGTITSMDTGFPKLNTVLTDGLEWNRIITIAGISGSGKSTIAENLKRNFVLFNEEDVEILSFEFEMLPMDQLTRNISGMMGKTVKELFSAGKKLTDSELDTAFNLLDKMEVWPVSYVSTVGTVTDIHNTVLSFALNKQLAEKKKKLIVTVDHTLLTKRKQGQGEKAVVDSLMHTLNELKKYLPTLGIECIFIVLSQLNRDIESGDRVLIPSLHYPTKADIFGASSVFYSSDYVMITHKPIDISGMGSAYGPPIGGFPKGLPVKHPSTNQNMVYWHVIKGRFAEKSIIMMVDDFKNSRIFEYDAKQYSKLEE